MQTENEVTGSISTDHFIRISKIENVRMVERYDAKKSYVGNLYLTTSHLIFRDPKCKKEFWILYSHISNLEKAPLSTSGSPLVIRCKTFLCVTFIIQKDRDAHLVFTSLQQLALPPRIEMLYCFRYKALMENIPKQAGWNFYDLQAEYHRMQVPNDEWCLSLINKNYELCDTYPCYLYVPTTSTPSILTGSSKFRSRGRLPVLSYLHPKTKAVICRCSQPLSGFSARCFEDEQMLDCILRANPSCTYMYVVDTRPKINAMANRAAGRGYENENFYDNIKFYFVGIENIHVMRNSLSKLIDCCDPKHTSMSAFLNAVDSWLRHIKALLDASLFIAQAIDCGVSVVVHCSDGWDRTAQVCSLASVMLDPYYRTIQGYQALIEKDWLAFGHKFTDRYGFIANDQREISPVFTQFIESTWQLYTLSPCEFEFNERYLIMLHDQFTSCQFGTFIGNSEKERVDLKLSSRTFSLWGYVANHIHEFKNPFYSPKDNDTALQPDLCSQNLKFWRSLYCRFDTGVHPRENVEDIVQSIAEHTTSLTDHLKFLEKKVNTFKEALSSHEKKSRNTPEENHVIGEKAIKKISITEQNGSIPVISFTNEKGDHLNNDPAQGAEFEEVIANINSISINWRPLRSMKYCVCSTPFEYSSKRHHCWKCGEIFCTRCMSKQQVSLPGHSSKRSVPVCVKCYANITGSSIEDSIPKYS